MYIKLVGKTVGVGKYKELSSEEIIAAIARHGIIKEDKGKLVKFLMDSSHWSPLDMINFVFEIETSRAMGRHLLRHNIKPQEHSQRYSDDVHFEPIELRKESSTNRQSSTEVFNPEVETAWGDEMLRRDAESAINDVLYVIADCYKELINVGVAKECARMILPMCTQTTIFMTGSIRSWIHFLEIRDDSHAQLEAQLIAKEIKKIFIKELPLISKARGYEIHN